MKKLNFVVIIALFIMLFAAPVFADIVMDPPIDDYLEILNVTWTAQPSPNYDIGRIKLKIKIKQNIGQSLNLGNLQAIFIDKDGVELDNSYISFYGSYKKGTIKILRIMSVPYNTVKIKLSINE